MSDEMITEDSKKNPHVKATKKEPKVETPVSTPAVATGDFVDETTLSKEERIAKLNADYYGETLTFPIGEVEHYKALEVSSTFTLDNLKEGQVFSINHKRNVFFFLPECDISLNDSNYKWEYRKENVKSHTLGYLLHAVRACDILVGDTKIEKLKPRPAKSGIDCNTVLSLQYPQFVEEIKEILSKKQVVLADGSIDSPGIDIKALQDYEQSHLRRPKYIKLLKQAADKVGAFISFLNQFDEEEKVSGRKVSVPPARVSPSTAVNAW